MSDGVVKKERSAWFYVGIGCGSLVVIGIVLLVVGGLMLRSWGKQLVSQMNDPAAQARAVKRLLGTDKLPDGYFAVSAMPQAMMIDSVVLAGRPLEPGKPVDYGDRGFIYFNAPYSELQRRAFDDYARGKSPDLRSSGVGGMLRLIPPGERIRAGEVQLPSGASVRYVARRGDLSRLRIPKPGIANVLWIECPGTPRIREALWFTVDPDPGAPVDSARFQGSAADEATLSSFLSAFNFCLPPR